MTGRRSLLRRRVARWGRVVRNGITDLRFGRPLGLTYLRDARKSNSDYRVLRSIFDGRLHPGDVLVDVGCGGGRVINCWLGMGFTGQIYGLEADRRLARSAEHRLRGRANVEIRHGDAVDTLPDDATVLFLFNPFDAATMERFAARITSDLSGDLTILYLNCKHLEPFLRRAEFHVDLTDPGGVASEAGHRLAVITRSRGSAPERVPGDTDPVG